MINPYYRCNWRS